MQYLSFFNLVLLSSSLHAQQPLPSFWLGCGADELNISDAQVLKGTITAATLPPFSRFTLIIYLL